VKGRRIKPGAGFRLNSKENGTHEERVYPEVAMLEKVKGPNRGGEGSMNLGNREKVAPSREREFALLGEREGNLEGFPSQGEKGRTSASKRGRGRWGTEDESSIASRQGDCWPSIRLRKRKPARITAQAIEGRMPLIKDDVNFIGKLFVRRKK